MKAFYNVSETNLCLLHTKHFTKHLNNCLAYNSAMTHHIISLKNRPNTSALMIITWEQCQYS